MVKKAHFVDIDVILDMGNKAWVVDKNKPSIPIMKISKSDFNLLQNGIYRKQGNKVEFNGKTFWLPDNLSNELKVKSKNHRVPFSDFAISLQEFMNKDLIDNLEFDLNLELFESLKNTTDDIYIICSKQTKISHDLIIQKIQDKLKEEGLQIKNFYFISETFYNQKEDEVEHKKLRLLLQHAIGYRTDGDKFTDKEITRYDVIEYYDNNLDTMMLSKELNQFLNMIWKKTDDGLRSVIKEDIEEYKPQIIVNKIFDNNVNRIESGKVKLSVSNIFKTFESFKLFESSKSFWEKLDREDYWSNKPERIREPFTNTERASIYQIFNKDYWKEWPSRNAKSIKEIDEFKSSITIEMKTNGKTLCSIHVEKESDEWFWCKVVRFVDTAPAAIYKADQFDGLMDLLKFISLDLEKVYR